MTDFLKDLEVQLTAAAHRAVAERARPPRPRRWPTLAFVAVAGVAVVAMVLMPARGQLANDRPGKPKPTPASLRDTRVGVYNAAGVSGVASSASVTLSKRGAQASPDTVPPDRARAYSKVYFAKGRASQARSVGQVLGIDRIGSPLPDLGAERRYDVVVLLGEDFVKPAKRLLDNFALLREATNRTIDTAAGPVRVTSTKSGLCLQIHDHAGWGGTCVDVVDALAGKAVAASRRADGRLNGAVGLVPDGVEAVDLGEIDGTIRRLPVGRNLWAIGAEKVVSVTFGTTTITVP